MGVWGPVCGCVVRCAGVLVLVCACACGRGRVCARVLVWVRVRVRVLVFVDCFFFSFLDFCLLGFFVLVYIFEASILSF